MQEIDTSKTRIIFKVVLTHNDIRFYHLLKKVDLDYRLRHAAQEVHQNKSYTISDAKEFENHVKLTERFELLIANTSKMNLPVMIGMVQTVRFQNKTTKAKITKIESQFFSDENIIIYTFQLNKL